MNSEVAEEREERVEDSVFELDHVAIQTHDIAASVAFYVEHFRAEVLYQDTTWAFLRLGEGKLALVTPSQHPPHIALRVSEETLERAAARAGLPIDRHRDGTTGIYIDDPQGNVVELICYPPGETVYDKG
jgi:catechol 2,3-dioxygenase-like lactoylglutathione lyase family enzyme